MTALGAAMPRAPTLNMERIKVVPAKEKRPLEIRSDLEPHRQGGGKYSQRSRVADNPQLRGGVVNVGVGRERASGGSSTTVVVVITDVVGVADGGLLGGSGHGGSSRMKKSEKGDWTWGERKRGRKRLRNDVAQQRTLNLYQPRIF